MALYLIIQVGAALSRILPRSWRYRIGTAVGDLVYLLWARKRRVIHRNMATVLGFAPTDPRVRRLGRESMRNYCKYLIEFLELPIISPQDPIVTSMKIDGLEHVYRAVERGRGVILTTAHYGTIELPGLRLAAITDFHAVYDTFRPPYLDRLIQRKRREKGMDLIAVNDVRKMIRVLRHGGTIALLFDRPVPSARGAAVRFFGKDTGVPAGPAVLAMKTGAALLTVFTAREKDNTFSAAVSPPIEWTPTGDRERDAQVIMQKVVDALQVAVQQRPDQWYMFRPMWPEEPMAGPAPAGLISRPSRPDGA